jgi:hypothetical protein
MVYNTLDYQVNEKKMFNKQLRDIEQQQKEDHEAKISWDYQNGQYYCMD